MRSTITLLFCVLVVQYAQARNYYFSAFSGDDSRSSVQANSPATPWKSLSKLNAIFATLQPGDSVLLRRGDVFFGTINATRSGVSGKPIVISAYGSGAKPVVTGFATVPSWKSLGGGKYESTAAISTLSHLSMVAVNGAATAMGRYPNADAPAGGYLSFESHLDKVAITDEQLTTATNWTGAEVVVRTKRYSIDRSQVITHVGGTLTFSPAMGYAPTDGFGYFLQNDVRTLDQFGEWYYNPTTKKIIVYFGTAGPGANSVQAAVATRLIYVYNEDYITVDGLALSGANETAIELYSADGIQVKNTDITCSNLYAVAASNARSLLMEHNTVNYTNNTGINLSNATYAQVKYNTVRNSSMQPGMIPKVGNSSNGMRETGSHNTIANNTVENSGGNGIMFNGDYTEVKNNYVTNFTMLKDDGGGVTTRMESKGRKITGNIILNGPGAAFGTNLATAGSTSGIYIDDWAVDVEVVGNTVSACSKAGIYLHNSQKITVRNNTLYDNKTQMVMTHDKIALDHPLRNIVIKGNVLFSKQPWQGVLAINTIKDDVAQMAAMDSNYYCRPLDDGYGIRLAFVDGSGTSVVQTLDLATWQQLYKKDGASRITAAQIVPHRISALVGSNLFTNGDFNSDIKGLGAGASVSTYTKSWVSGKLDGGSFQGTVTSAKPANYNLSIPMGAVSASKKYLVQFTAQASKDTLMNVHLRISGAPYTTVSNNGAKTGVRLTTKAKNYEFVFAPKESNNEAVLLFETSGTNLSFWVDKIRVQEVSATLTNPEDSIRFEYNPSSQPKTIQLPTTFIDPKGSRFNRTLQLAPFQSAIIYPNGVIVDTPVVKPVVLPVVSVTSPKTDTVYKASAAIKLTAAASDADGSISKVAFYQDTVLLKSLTAAPYEWTWTGVEAGTYTITAKATDNEGNVKVSSPVTFAVKEKAAPVVSLTSPKMDTAYKAAATVKLSAAATDADGLVSKVAFYQDTILLHSDSTAPYEWSWNNVAAGTYTITAKATDNEGGIATSAPVTLIVKAKLAPAVAITSPKMDTAFAASVSSVKLTADAADADGSVSKVEFYHDNILLKTLTAAPYEWIWNNMAPGTYAVTAKATDSDGLEVTSTAVAFTIKDPVAPLVAITNPKVDEVYGSSTASVTLAATASDADGHVSKVDFYNGSVLLQSITAAPFEWTWTGLTAGAYNITAKATDNEGNITASEAVSFSIKAAIAPVVFITSPAVDTVFKQSASVQLSAAASDADGAVSSVEFYNGDTLLHAVSSAPYEWTWNDVAAGSYTITVKAIDNEGNVSASHAVSFTVKAPTAPVVSIISPAMNSSHAGPASVRLIANATDADGSVSKVEFYNGTKLIVTERTAPYDWTWKGVAPGTYTVTAKATDNEGNVTITDGVSFTVKAPVAPVVAITSPVVSAQFTTPVYVQLAATASDEDGIISKVEFYINDTLVKIEKFAPYKAAWKPVAGGAYTFVAKAIDNSGNVTFSAPVTFAVTVPKANIAPNVSIVSPLISSAFSRTSLTQFTATANDVDGKVSKVEFFVNDSLVKIERYAPYTWSTKSLPAGRYIMVAKATDNKGATSLSVPVKFDVAASSVNNRATVNTNIAFYNNDALSENSQAVFVNASPNPANSYLSIRLWGVNTASSASVSIYSLSGTLVKTLSEVKGNNTIQTDVSALTPGMYLIKVVTENGTSSTQFLKQ